MTTQTTKQNNKIHFEIMELINDVKNIRKIMRHGQPDVVWDRLATAWSWSAREADRLAEKLGEDSRLEYRKMITRATNIPIKFKK